MNESRDSRPAKSSEPTEAGKQDRSLYDIAINEPGKIAAANRANDKSVQREANIEAATTTAGLFRTAIGLESVPHKGKIEWTAQRADMEAQRSEGISRAQNVCFVDANGDQLVGMQYTKSAGTVFKTKQGDTYSVQSDPTGGFILRLAADVEMFFSAIKMTVLPDLLGLSTESKITPRRASEEATALAAQEKKGVEAPSPLISFEPVNTPQAAPDLTLPIPVAVPEKVVDQVIEGKPFEAIDIEMETIAPAEVKIEAVNNVPIEAVHPPVAEAVQEEDSGAEEIVDQQLIEQAKQAKEERRRRYVVKEKDTLQTIAAKQLRDVRLADLIFDINKHLIPVKVVRGRPLRELKPRQVIFLPTSLEVADYRSQLASGLIAGASDDQPEDLESYTRRTVSAILAADAEPEIANKDGGAEKPIEPSVNATAQSAVPEIARTMHVARLGDTLKSIAIKHKDLGDVALWLLLARVNGLSTAADERGAPLAQLTRGMKLIIPNAEEVAEFRQSNFDPGANS